MVGIPIDLTDLGTLTNEQLMPFMRASGGGGRASGGGGSASGGSAGGGSLGGAGVERPWHVTGLRTKVETPQQWMVYISTYRPLLISTDLHQPSTDPPTHQQTNTPTHLPLPNLTNRLLPP